MSGILSRRDGGGRHGVGEFLEDRCNLVSHWSRRCELAESAELDNRPCSVVAASQENSAAREVSVGIIGVGGDGGVDARQRLVGEPGQEHEPAAVRLGCGGCRVEQPCGIEGAQASTSWPASVNTT